jgi:hypothetical protein
MVNGKTVFEDAKNAQHCRAMAQTCAHNGMHAAASTYRWRARAIEQGIRDYADRLIREAELKDCGDVPY